MKSILPIASLFALAAAGALSCTSTAMGMDPIDPADPWTPPSGQYPSLMQNWGAAPQFQNTESIGMREARFANGGPANNAPVPGGIIEMGPTSVVTLAAPDTCGGALVPGAATTAVVAQVNANEAPNSPVMNSINAALAAIGAARGPDAVVASNAIDPALRDAPYGCHAAFAVYQLRVQQSESQVDALQGRAAQFAGDQGDYNAAMQDVRTLSAKLNQDFSDAQNASPQDWPQVRATLADDYASYGAAVARAQRAASGNRT